MNNFKDFLYENFIVEAKDSAYIDDIIKEVEGILASYSYPYEVQFLMNNPKTTQKQLFFKVFTEEKYRSILGSVLQEEIKKKYKIGSIPNGEKFGVKYNMENVPENILILVKPNGKGSKKMDPNEAMTACLLALPNFELPTNDTEMDILIEEAIKMKSKIKNAPKDVFDFFNKDYVNLIQAASAAMAIRNKIKEVPEEIYLTGGTYPKEIEFLKISHLEMKDYNSSDIVLKLKDSYVGISLKKAINKKAIPTLLNKSYDKVLDQKSDLQKCLKEATDDFFNSVVKDKLKINVKNQEWKKHIAKIDGQVVNAIIKSNPTHFKKIYDEFIKMDETAIFNLLSLIFKLDLKRLIDKEFSFYLVTGIGDYGVKKGIVIEEGAITELNTIIDVLEKLNNKNKIQIKAASDKKQSFEEGASAAKLFFDIYCDNISIVHLEIRYKGNFSAQPQIFAFLSEDFKKLIH